MVGQLMRETLMRIDAHTFLRRSAAKILHDGFRPNGFVLTEIFEFEDKMAKALGRPHRVELRAKLTARSLLWE